MTDHPPLVPAEVDLRDFPFMPLDIIRLFGSRFHAIASDAEWRAGVTLWAKSFHQVPAASLPDDDVELCRLAELGRDIKQWRKLREVAMHGWIKCNDGRWYHPVMAEKANEAWARKMSRRDRAAKGNAARWGGVRRDADERAIVDGSAKERGDDPRDVPQRSHKESFKDSLKESLEESSSDPKGQGQGQGQGYLSANPSRAIAADAPMTPDASVEQQPPPEAPPNRSAYPAEFEAVWAIYPKRAGGNSKADALKAWRARRAQGVSPEALHAGVERYAAFLRATGKLGTEFVKQAATFFGPGECWREPWAPPDHPGNVTPLRLAVVGGQVGVEADGDW